jgi:hypothetical protein
MPSLGSPRLRVRTDHPYQGRTAVLGTKHRKGEQLAVPLMGMVGLSVQSVDVDTDLLGTFVGEVPRTLSMRDAAIAKARMAMQSAGCALGLASEGTIGPDPRVPLLTSDLELIVLVDDEADAVILESVRDLGIAVASTALRPGDDLSPFLARAGFPDHRLIVRPDGIEPAEVPAGLLHKGLADRGALEQAITACAEASPTGQARVESDLRAHCSPSRRPVITRAAWRLGYRLASRCPACASPGWGPVDTLRGLPCELCGDWIPGAARGQVLGCGRCSYQVDRPDGRTAGNPANCPSCNP